MNSLLAKAAVVGLLLFGAVMIAVAQHEAGVVSDDEAATVRGAGCEKWVKDGGCPNPENTGCGAYDDYDYEDGTGGTSKWSSSLHCGASACGHYDTATSCDPQS